MKVKESDLIIGDEYWIDEAKTASGIYIGVFDNSVLFYETLNSGDWCANEEGLIGLYGFLPNTEYEEVE